MRLRVMILLMVLLAPSMFAAKDGIPSLALKINGNTVTASGCAPGANVVWFGVAREGMKFQSRLVRHQVVVVADAAGVATFDRGKAVPAGSMWVAVDQSNGAYGFVAPADAPALPFDDTDAVIKSAGEARKILSRHALIDVLLVRPGSGAWAMRTGEGFDNDDNSNGHGNGNGNHGQVNASLDHLGPITAGGAAAPKDMRKGDVLALLDARSMSYVVTRIGEKD